MLLKHWFSKFGFPQIIRSDGGPQFRTEFSEFCKTYGIMHELSSPYNPQSNGLAESAVKSMKHLVKKCNETGQDKEIALHEFRNFPGSVKI